MQLNNETKIGLMVIAGAIILLGITVKAGNFTLKKDGYRIAATFNDIDGVSKNSPVMLNGLEVGVVENIQIKYGDDQTVMELTLWLNNTAKLKQGAKAIIKNLGFMGEKYIALTAGDPHAAYLQPGATLQGQPPADINQLMSDGHELLGKANDIVTNIDQRLKTNEKNIDDTLANLNVTMTHMSSLTQHLDKIVGANESNINNILANVNAVSFNLKDASSNLDDMSADLKKNPWKLFFRAKEKH
ncbi:MAG: MCE family protein [Candidatus Omnitrophica bacterium]|nr:MCE family protein [Candidatus Omnitrophota bacterium]